MDAYGPELAALHHAHFGEVARRAAACLVEELASAGRTAGTIVDLGSGSGLLARCACDAGFEVFGVERSEGMLTLAREHAPNACFVRGSAWTAELPRCVAACAVGEVFNYALEPDSTHDLRALERRLVEIRAALEPSGVLLFDLSGPGRVDGGVRTREYELGEWHLTMTLREDRGARRMVREHVLRRRGDARELVERHELVLHAPEDVLAALVRAGFTPTPRTEYGEPTVRPGWRVFCARADGTSTRR